RRQQRWGGSKRGTTPPSLRSGTPPNLGGALHKKSWAVIERPYSCAPQAVGAVYDRPGFFVQSPEAGWMRRVKRGADGWREARARQGEASIANRRKVCRTDHRGCAGSPLAAGAATPPRRVGGY